MVYSSFLDFAFEYNGKKLESHNYYGFDMSIGNNRLHIHCKTFNVYERNPKNELTTDQVTLFDANGHIIVKVLTDDVVGVTSCKANYWDVNGQLYLKGWD